jgi:hypothetical protein
MNDFDTGRIISVIGLIIFLTLIMFLMFGCSSMDREMMEWEGVYDCVEMSDGGAFCK